MNAGTIFISQHLTSTYVILCHLKTVPALKVVTELKWWAYVRGRSDPPYYIVYLTIYQIRTLPFMGLWGSGYYHLPRDGDQNILIHLQLGIAKTFLVSENKN